jgi:dephospho-CoA kinase
MIPEAARNARRVLVLGGPRTGKTTLGQEFASDAGLPLLSTDDTASLDWSEASAQVAGWIDPAGEWVIEGVSAARALRKWLNRNPEVRLDAIVVLMNRPRLELSKGQEAMRKGVATVWDEIVAEALRRGVRVVKVDGAPESSTQAPTRTTA